MERHEAFAQAARLFPEPTLLVTAAGIVRSANPACGAVFHNTDLEGRSLFELVATPADDLAEYLALCCRSRQVVLGAVTIPAADGSTVPYRCEGALVDGPAGAAPGLVLLRLRPRSEAAQRFIGLSQQVQELQAEIRRRKAVEEALRASDAFARSILDSSADCITVLDLEGRLLSMNEPGKRALCIPDLTRHLDTSWIEFWQGSDRDAARRAVDAAAAGGTGKFVGYFPIEGEPKWWDVVVTPIPWAGARPTGLLAVSRDVTDQRRIEQERVELLRRERAAREQAELANRLKDEFLATLSHELRTPLNAILGWTRILRAGASVATPDKTDRGLAAIERNARVQAQLVEDLLDVSRIVTGKLRLEFLPVDLGAVVESAVDAVRPAATNKNIGLDVHVDAGATTVRGDAARLQQIVWNLLTNAVKFTPGGGHVSVQVRREDRHAEVSVADTGQGIAPEFLPHVFDRFRQADATFRRSHGGLGLGLALVRDFTEAHGGSIDVASPGVGQGATFTLRLPLFTGAAAEQPPSTPGESSLRGLRVLVVDDNPDARELLVLTLQSAGAVPFAAASVREALRLLNDTSPELLLADIGMPDEDGYELIRAVRALPHDAGGGLPAIAVTAYATPTERDRALRAGYDAHVPKPIDWEALMSAVARVVGTGSG